ncbi:putative protein YqjD [Rhodocyclaceae bacterium]|nr:putative protein YqjD [Rhodocyclaceae bacterium]
MNTSVNTSKDKLVEDLRMVVADAEELLKATASQTGERIAAARARAGESLQVAKARLDDAQAAVVERTKVAARATDDYVHDNPWQAIGIAATVGLILGALISRR